MELEERQHTLAGRCPRNRLVSRKLNIQFTLELRDHLSFSTKDPLQARLARFEPSVL